MQPSSTERFSTAVFGLVTSRPLLIVFGVVAGGILTVGVVVGITNGFEFRSGVATALGAVMAGLLGASVTSFAVWPPTRAAEYGLREIASNRRRAVRNVVVRQRSIQLDERETAVARDYASALVDHTPYEAARLLLIFPGLICLSVLQLITYTGGFQLVFVLATLVIAIAGLAFGMPQMRRLLANAEEFEAAAALTDVE